MGSGDVPGRLPAPEPDAGSARLSWRPDRIAAHPCQARVLTVAALITSRDRVRTYRTALLRPPSVVIFGVVLVVLVVVEAVLRTAQVALFGAMFVGLLAVPPWLQAFGARKSLPTEPTTWTVIDEGLAIRNDISDSVVKW